MEGNPVLEILAIFILIFANGFFALSEFSIIASRKTKLRQKIEEGKRGAKAALKLHDNPDKFLATVQVGIGLFATLAGVFGGATLAGSLHKIFASVSIPIIASNAKTLSVVVVTLLITVFSVVLGELVPKYIALSNPEFYGRHVARPISLFIKLTSFFSTLLSYVSNLVLKIFGIKVNADRSMVSEDEINLMIFEGKQKGVFDEIEERLIKSVFDFADSTVKRAMTPRIDVDAIDIKADYKDIFNTIINNGYSRYPIFEKTIDNIIGVIYTKDIIIHKLNPELIILKDLLREPLFVPDSMPLSKLLNIFQMKKQHIAIVLDEYGGTAGIITLEDILEELVGEIQDEYDVEREPLVKHSDTVAFAEGTVWVGAINELMNSKLPEDKAESLGGLIIDHLGYIPKKDDTLIIEDVKITILEQLENRLVRMKLEKINGNSDKHEG